MCQWWKVRGPIRQLRRWLSSIRQLASSRPEQMCVVIGTRLAGDLAASVGATSECCAADAPQGSKAEEYQKESRERDGHEHGRALRRTEFFHHSPHHLL